MEDAKRMKAKVGKKSVRGLKLGKCNYACQGKVVKGFIPGQGYTKVKKVFCHKKNAKCGRSRVRRVQSAGWATRLFGFGK